MRKKVIILLLLVFLIVSNVALSLAWFKKPERLSSSFSGSIKSTYFKEGDGSLGNPYVISSPVHLYNLAWLQYIGYFNLGSNNGLAQNYFLLVNDVDMSGMVLPPIGTTQYPFVGNFDGGDFVISNLVTANVATAFSSRPLTSMFNATNSLLSEYDVNSTTEAGAIIGFFGVVGDYDGKVAQINSDLDETNDVDETKIEIKNFGLYNVTIADSSTQTVAGIVAGGVYCSDVTTTNPETHQVTTEKTKIISNVVVSNCTLAVNNTANALTSVTSNLSDLVLIGHTNNVQTKEGLATNYNQLVGEFIFSGEDGSGGDGGNSWGSSVDMASIFTRLVNISSSLDAGVVNANTSTGPIYSPDIYGNMVNTGATTQSLSHPNGSYYVYDDNQMMGSFSYYYDSNNEENARFHLNGGRYAYNNGHKITIDGTNYLKIDATDTNNLVVTNATSKADGSVFLVDKVAKTIKFYVNNTAYYLGQQNGNLTTFRTTASLSNDNYQWTIDDGAFKITANYFLDFDSSGWKLTYYSDNSMSTIFFIQKNRYVQLTETNGTFSSSYVTSEASATKFRFVNGCLFATSADNAGLNTDVYLYGAYNAPVGYIATSAGASKNRWTKVSGDGYCILQYGGYAVYSGSQLHCANGDNYNGDNAHVIFTAGDAVEFATVTTEIAYINGIPKTNMKYADDGTGDSIPDVTYIPLNVGDGNEVSTINTGYIIGGSKNSATSNGGDGNVTISNYPNNNTYLANFNYATGMFNSLFTVDSSNNVSAINNVSGAYVNYDKVKTAIEGVVGRVVDGNRVYLQGLHFLDAQISKESLVRAQYVCINGVEYTNYQLPANSIDFCLKTKGYITFVAGNYSASGDATYFFSLHQIVRNNDNDISDIKEIAQIYSKTNVSTYIYKYTDGTYSGDLTNEYSLIFDLSRLGTDAETRQKLRQAQNNAFYFEIPVNAGEYALGSVDIGDEAGTGSYLLYLDIGTGIATDTSSYEYEIDRTLTPICEYAEGIAVKNETATVTEVGWTLNGENVSGAVVVNVDEGNATCTAKEDNAFSGNVATNVVDEKLVVFSFTDAYDEQLATITIVKTGSDAPVVTSNVNANLVSYTYLDNLLTLRELATNYSVTFLIDWNDFENDVGCITKNPVD